MRYIITSLGAVALMLFGAGSALAAPFNAANNPQIVANFQSGNHGVVGELVLHQGADVVMTTGPNGGIQQWFYGTSEEPGGTHGDHSRWLPVGDATTCQNSDWILVVNARASWGDYLAPGNYCVHTNDFHPSN